MINGKLRELQFNLMASKPLLHIYPLHFYFDSQSNPAGCDAVLLRGHIWIVFRG